MAPLLLIVLGLALALGDLGPWSPYALLWRLPPFTSGRAPARALLLSSIGACLLAGIGLDRASALLGRRRAATALLLLLAAERVDDFVAMKAGAFPAAFRIAGPGRRPRDGGARLHVGGANVNDAMVGQVRSPWGYDPLIPWRVVLLWNAIQPGMFRFDAHGRLATPFPGPSADELPPQVAQALAPLGVSQLQGPRRMMEKLRKIPGATRDRRGACHLPGGARAMRWSAVRAARSPEEALRDLRRIPPEVSVLDVGAMIGSGEERSVALPEGADLASPVSLVTMTAGCPEPGTLAEVAIEGSRGSSTVTLACGQDRDGAPTSSPVVAPGKVRTILIDGRALLVATFEWDPSAVGEPRRMVVRPTGARVMVDDIRWRAQAPRPPQTRPPIVEPTGVAAPIERGPAPGAPPAVLRAAASSGTRLDVRLDGIPGTVVVADTFYPGWQARVDGTPVPIAPANVALMAVAVPEGSRQLELRFAPSSFRLGLFLTCAVIAGLAAERFCGRPVARLGSRSHRPTVP